MLIRIDLLENSLYIFILFLSTNSFFYQKLKKLYIQFHYQRVTELLKYIILILKYITELLTNC